MRHWAILIGIFGLALIIRVSALGGFVTIDEPRWLDRSRWFITGLLVPDRECPPVKWGREFATQGWGCTFQIGYPGVTTMWGGSLGLWLYYWHTGRSTEIDIDTFLRTLRLYPGIDPAIIVPIRLPFAVAGALFVPLFYLLLRRLLSERVALGAALLIALHPFHIGLSRVIHHDGLNTMFMVLSLLTLIGYWLRGWPWYCLLISAAMGGLAFLSKQVSWFMLPYVGVLGGLSLYYRWQSPRWQGWIEVWRLMGAGIVWGAVAGLTFVAFFPAMWVIPGEVIRVIVDASTRLAEEGQPHYFLGQITQDPGLLFYPVGWLLRSSLLELLGLLGALVASWRFFRTRSLSRQALNRPVEVALALFVGLLWLFVTVSDKKLERYFLPAFPIIDVFAAMGLFWLVDRLARFSYNGMIRRWSVPLVAGVILLGQGGLVLEHYPYYFTYYNPLGGGPPGAAHLITIEGWGEGLNEAAAYLNRKPAAKSLHVVVEMWCSTFTPFFVGKANCLNSNAGGIMGADFMIYYYNVVQRNLQRGDQWRYFDRHHLPEHRVTLHGLDYVLIYRNPIQNQIDREANSLPGIFTPFGYNLAGDGQLTLFWQNLGVGRQQLKVGLAPSNGVYSKDAPTASTIGARQWVACTPRPDFVDEMNIPGAIIESLCPLTTANIPPGLYDLQLGLSDGSTVSPLASSLLGVLLIDPNKRFTSVELGQAPAQSISFLR
ncbi:MAG: glycosyltransferase family 39 protein [Chloroflexi bacterium]|nr:glycosyltransferase family 39 protein [Chloroflexota bacterium]